MLLHTVEPNASSLFSARHSLAIRVWHWVMFLFISASLIMVLLASTMFATKSNVALVTEQVTNKGGVITQVQARAVAHEYSDKLWMAHKYIGYALSILLLMRILIEIFNPKKERLATNIKTALSYKSSQLANADSRHYLVVKYGYLFFYAMILTMAITGLGLAYEDVPYLRAIHKPLSQVHSVVQYMIYFYILAHLVGVIRADATFKKGIVSGMINGDAT